MQPTPIKINKSPNGQSEPTKNILNLNGSTSKLLSNNKIKKYLWFLLAIVLIEAGGLVWLYLAKPVSPYFKLLPPNIVASSYFDQAALLGLLKNNTSQPPIALGNSELKSWLAKTKIEQPDQILRLFGSQMVLAIKENSTWLILAEIKVPTDAFKQARDRTEQSLKQNYNLISESYRQITITQVKPLNRKEESLFYAEARGYFILTNDSDLIKATMDKIIK